MQYPPLTDEEMAELRKPLAEGEASFVVENAIEGTSSKGDGMITLTLRVTDCEGREGTLNDWLLNTRKMAFKIKAFLKSIGREDEFDNGELNVFSIRGAGGYCKLKHKPAKDPQYGMNAVVANYIPIEKVGAPATSVQPDTTATQTVGPAPAPSDEGIDDDLPF